MKVRKGSKGNIAPILQEQWPGQSSSSGTTTSTAKATTKERRGRRLMHRPGSSLLSSGWGPSPSCRLSSFSLSCMKKWNEFDRLLLSLNRRQGSKNLKKRRFPLSFSGHDSLCPRRLTFGETRRQCLSYQNNGHIHTLNSSFLVFSIQPTRLSIKNGE